MSNLQTTTIRVPKEVVESIKIYCKKNGRNVGNWVEDAWYFIQKNEFDIYDQDSTPFLPVKEELLTLNGIGESKALAIIEYRNTSKFNTIEELMNVSGIGESLYNKVKDSITV